MCWPSVVAKVAEAAGLRPEDLTFIFAPTQSLAGSTQVVARVLEVALHKAHTVGFDLHAIVDGIGSAPLSPPHPDFIKAMGRTNDAIIYGGRVQLFVDADDADAKQLAEQIPSTTSSDHGAVVPVDRTASTKPATSNSPSPVATRLARQSV